MDLTVQNVYGLLIRSKLLSLDECKEMFARWNTEAKENAGNLALFAKWIVARGYLTEYQAALLARGHADGFYLGGYKVLDRLGKGRMAGVYRAQHDTGPVVAIKVLPPSKARDRQMRGRFQRIPLWGQFVDRHGEVREHAAKRFLDRLDRQAGRLEGIDECFPFQVIGVQAPVRVFLDWYRAGGPG